MNIQQYTAGSVKYLKLYENVVIHIVMIGDMLQILIIDNMDAIYIHYTVKVVSCLALSTLKKKATELLKQYSWSHHFNLLFLSTFNLININQLTIQGIAC